MAINENGGKKTPAAEVCKLFNYKGFSGKSQLKRRGWAPFKEA